MRDQTRHSTAPDFRDFIDKLLRQGLKAGCRLKQSSDSEALHDFRVAVRRLRTHVQSYRHELGKAASQKIRRRLKRIANATTSARDAEAAWERLNNPKPVWPTAARQHAKTIAMEFKRQRRQEQRVLIRMTDLFLKTAKKIRHRLASTPKTTFSKHDTLARQLIIEQSRKLHRCLVRARSQHAELAIHRARIEAKKLRYLLEPLQQQIAHVGKLIRLLKDAQNCLGNIHDLQLLRGDIRITSPAEATALQRLLHREQSQAFGQFGKLKPLLSRALVRQARLLA